MGGLSLRCVFVSWCIAGWLRGDDFHCEIGCVINSVALIIMEQVGYGVRIMMKAGLSIPGGEFEGIGYLCDFDVFYEIRDGQSVYLPI